jgi:hypothetical protein
LLLVANVGEEGEGNLLGMRYLCKQSPLARKIEAMLVVDGANTDHITNRALGSRRFEIAFSGPGGHSWSDYGVGNPLHALCRAVALFAETRIEGVPKSAINVGLIEGGSSVNAIAQRRAPRWISARKAITRMDELVELLSAAVDRARETENQRATGGKVTAKLKEIGSRPAAALPETAPILQCVRAVDAHLGIRSHLDCSSTDANIPLSLGIPAAGHRRRRIGRRRPYHAGMVPAGRARFGAEAHFPDPASLMRGAPRRCGERGQVNRRRAAEAALVFNVILWGATFVVVKAALADVSPRPVSGVAIHPGHRGAAHYVFRGRGFAVAIVENRRRGRSCGNISLFPATLFRPWACASPPRPGRHSSPD